jgi:mono/diheme cytochrome c family protein
MIWYWRVRYLYFSTLMLGISSLLVNCWSPTPKVDLAAAAQGKALYHTLACDSCHGLDAVGSTRTYAPTHNHLRATAEQRISAVDYSGQATTAAEYIRESIVDPKAYMVAGYQHVRFGMPSFAHLSEREVNALVQFLLQQE